MAQNYQVVEPQTTTFVSYPDTGVTMQQFLTILQQFQQNEKKLSCVRFELDFRGQIFKDDAGALLGIT